MKKYFRETMAGGHGQGKKLGFIAQEMGREINTGRQRFIRQISGSSIKDVLR